MPLPDIDALTSLGGTLVNYAPVEDATTDLDAGADNKARNNVAMMTHTVIRAWARFTTAASTGALVLVAHDALWGNLPGVAPTLARSSAGTFTLTYPTSVNDEITPPNAHTLAFRGGTANVRSAAAAYIASLIPTSANVATVYLRDTTNTLVDAVGTDVDVFLL